MVIDWRCQLVKYPGEVMTDMDYSIYPAGFYTVRAAASCAFPFPDTVPAVLTATLAAVRWAHAPSS